MNYGLGRLESEKINVIYRVIDTLTGEMYVGSKVNYKSGKYYGSPRLKRAREIIAARPETLVVEILEIVDDREKLLDKEVYWQKAFNVVEDKMYWNQCYAMKGFCSIGKKLSEEHKEKIKADGRKHTDETKERMRIIATGRPLSEESKLKISKVHKGKTITPDHVEKIRARHIGNKYRLGTTATDDTKKKMSLKRKGVPKSEETKERMKLGWTKRKQKQNEYRLQQNQ